IGVIGDPKGNGQMKVYGFFGRFSSSVPTDLNVRSYGAQIQATSYNFSPSDTAQDPAVIGHPGAFFQGGSSAEPVQPNLKGIYQDEVSAAFDMLLDPTFPAGVHGTDRHLGRP